MSDLRGLQDRRDRQAAPAGQARPAIADTTGRHRRALAGRDRQARPGLTARRELQDRPEPLRVAGVTGPTGAQGNTGRYGGHWWNSGQQGKLQIQDRRVRPDLQEQQATLAGPAGTGRTGNTGNTGGVGNTGATGQALISTTTTSGSQASVTISSIPSTYSQPTLLIQGRCTIADVADSVLLQFNGDTAAHCLRSMLQRPAPQEQALIRAVLPETHLLATLPGASATASYAEQIAVTISNYAGTTFFKNFVANNAFAWSTSSGQQETISSGGQWGSTAAINSIKIFNASAFVDGTLINLYGMQ